MMRLSMSPDMKSELSYDESLRLLIRTYGEVWMIVRAAPREVALVSKIFGVREPIVWHDLFNLEQALRACQTEPSPVS